MKSLLHATLYLLAVVIVAHSCQTESELTVSDKDAIVQEVKQVSQEYWSLLKQPYGSTTYSESLKYMDENADQIWLTEPVSVIFNTAITMTQAEWLTNYKSMIDNRISTDVTVLESYYSVLSSDKVLEVIKGEYTITRKDSSVVGPFIMANTAIWTNINGDWKNQYWHSSYMLKEE